MSERPILEVVDLVKHFPIHRGLLSREVGQVRAVDGVSIEVASGEEWGIYIAVFFSLHALLEKYNIEEVGLGSYMLWVGPLITLFNWAMVYFTKSELAPYSTFLKPDMLAAVLLPVVSGWTYVAAISVAQIAVVNYVSGLSVVAAVAAGRAGRARACPAAWHPSGLPEACRARCRARVWSGIPSAAPPDRSTAQSSQQTGV